MARVRIGIIGAGAVTEWAVLPALSGPDATLPPDSGAWWGRRPGGSTDIRYQAPYEPEVVALADRDADLVARVAGAARIRGVYSDWRVMLREAGLDALCVTDSSLAAEVMPVAARAVPAVWLYGPPAATAAGALQLAQRLEAQPLHLWLANPWRQAAAHRAARRLLERNELGDIVAVTLRWGAPLPAADGSGLASAYAALDLLTAFASTTGPAAVPQDIMAATRHGATSLWLRFVSGATATALLASAESWSTPLPRLEVTGMEGRHLVCEAGRRLWLHLPRESARLLEPPGLAAHISGANLVGVAEDLKLFLMAVAAGDRAPRPGALGEAARTLQLLEGVREAESTGHSVKLEAMPRLGSEATHTALRPTAAGQVPSAPPVTATLPLPL